MGYEDLIQHLIRSAEAGREEILSHGRQEAERCIAEALEEAGRMERASEEGLAREVSRERRARMNRIKMEARAALLRTRVLLMDEIFARLEERLSHLPQETEYSRLVEQLYREVLPELPEGNVTLRADAKALAMLKALISDPRVRFESLPEEEFAGLEASDEAGRIRVRNTLKARFIKARPVLMVEINRWLSKANA